MKIIQFIGALIICWLWLDHPAQAHKEPDSLCPRVAISPHCPMDGVCPKSMTIVMPVERVCDNEPPVPGVFNCDVPKNCSDMISNDEALFYLNTCGQGRLDWDGDGEPCESRSY